LNKLPNANGKEWFRLKYMKTVLPDTIKSTIIKINIYMLPSRNTNPTIATKQIAQSLYLQRALQNIHTHIDCQIAYLRGTKMPKSESR